MIENTDTTKELIQDEKYQYTGFILPFIIFKLF